MVSGARVPCRALMVLLAGIFALRVAAQALVHVHPVALLPGFDLWHSAVLPYEVLLGWQLVILASMGFAIRAAPFRKPHPRLAAVLTVLGWVYVGIMAIRLVAGAGGLAAPTWFDGAIPTVFHFGLASFLLVFASELGGARAASETGWPRRLARHAAYPALLTGSYALYAWMSSTGAPLLFSSFLAVLAGGIGVLLHETFAPAREDWRPKAKDVAVDSLFLVFVQVLLPALLKASALALIVVLSGTAEAPFTSLWPHDAPVPVQVLAMMTVAEFFRYWLHRALHDIGPLWRLHAVHHSTDKLYTLNVGRFHPFDKALQFLGDTLPFLLLGLGPEVFAAYFVLYAVNGFYQHSNADLQLGPLNLLIAGPELHRWHHSTTLAESRSNYGNNLVVWDTVFGTRYLPENRAVGEVGIGDPVGPRGFPARLKAPLAALTDGEGT